MSCRAPCRFRSHRGFCAAKAFAAGDKSTGFCLWLCPGTEGAAIPLPSKGEKVSKGAGCLCCCCSGVTSRCSAVRSESSLLLEGASSCGNCWGMSPLVLECQPQAWHQSVFASGRCDSTAWSWSISCSEGSVLERDVLGAILCLLEHPKLRDSAVERPAQVVGSPGMCWEPSWPSAWSCSLLLHTWSSSPCSGFAFTG